MNELDPQSLKAESDTQLAVIGMAARVPGARSVAEYWSNLRGGVESVQQYGEEQLRAEGVTATQLRDRNYVRAGAPLEMMEYFDADFFGFSPKEAAIMDPQHRQFLECCWEALEDGTHLPSNFSGSIGVYAGCGMGSYLMFNLASNRELMESVGLFLLRHTGNDKDFLATRVSYCLNLTGPSINVQTACSTSLVAIHMACQSLLNCECDLALAGGVTIELPHRVGYRFEPGEILSPDGHCRAFDARSEGTLFGSGAGVVVLRRLADALRDGDRIYAVVRGSAVNNDGANKVGYLAPSVDQQAAATAEALAVASVTADSIQYVAAHGTGTRIGDPIEVAALTQAFRQTTDRRQFCAIGSVKPNIGHLDTAAGVASFMGAALALHHGQIPPSINFSQPNPTIDFAESPFFVNSRLLDWPETNGSPRRASVNSLGVGGTNAHLVLEAAPTRQPTSASRQPHQLIRLSARSRRALDEYTLAMADDLEQRRQEQLADIAYTLEHGRAPFTQRRVVAVESASEAADWLRTGNASRVFTHRALTAPSVAFMFPGGGCQYHRMGAGLYESEAVYRDWIDRGCQRMHEQTQIDLRPLLLPTDAERDRVRQTMEQPALQLPAIFLVEYALAQLWMSRGVKPASLIGHSLGENTAACVAGVLSFDDALALVSLRGALFEQVPQGGMITVALPASEVLQMMPDTLDLATVNSPSMCVVSGPADELLSFTQTLQAADVEVQRVPIKIAAHSRLVEGILQPFAEFLQGLELHPPSIPLISNRSGTWLSPTEATDPNYWVQHLRHTVRFADGIETLMREADTIFLEVGPGKALSSLVRQHHAVPTHQGIIPSLRHAKEEVCDEAFWLTAEGRLWACGLTLEPRLGSSEESRQRLGLPTYRFQRQPYWIAPTPPQADAARPEALPLERTDRSTAWYYEPRWQRVDLNDIEGQRGDPAKPTNWLVFTDAFGLSEIVVERLRERGETVVVVRVGDSFHRFGPHDFAVLPEDGKEAYRQLLEQLQQDELLPTRMVHGWLLSHDKSHRPGSSFFDQAQTRGFYSLTYFTQAWEEFQADDDRVLTVVTNGMVRVDKEALTDPEKATVLGPVKVIPREIPSIRCRAIDVEFTASARDAWRDVAQQVIREVDDAAFTPDASHGENLVAYRQGARWKPSYQCVGLEEAQTSATRIRSRGVYWITGGLGGIGLTLARHLAQTAQARLILQGRTPLPPRETWSDWLERYSPRDATSRMIRAVIDLEAQGAEVMTAAADVADLGQMQRVLQDARQRFGALHGVIHAAGIVEDGPLLSKDATSAERVFCSKIHGTRVLHDVLAEETLDSFALCSSTSALLGPPGQVDYVGANCYLNAFTTWRNQQGASAVALNWGVWQEVGLGAQTRLALDREPDAVESRRENVRHPLFDERIQAKSHVEFRCTLAEDTDWVVDEHRTSGGQAVVPGTAYLQWVLSAAELESDRSSNHRIENVTFTTPCQLSPQERREVRLRLFESDDDRRPFEIHSRQVDDAWLPLSDWQLHVEGRVGANQVGSPQPKPIETINQNGRDRASQRVDGSLVTRQAEQLQLGPRWDCYQELHYGSGEAVAKLELPARYHDELNTYGLHPALLDMATGFGLPVSDRYDSSKLYVPMGYESVQVLSDLPPTVYSQVTSAQTMQDGAVITLDFNVMDADGNPLVIVTGLAMRRIDDQQRFAATSGDSDQRPMEPTRSAIQQLFVESYELGISPTEGAQAFETIVRADHRGELLITPVNPLQLQQRMDLATSSQTSQVLTFERPQLDSEFTAPRDELETTVAHVWQDLLGVETIGVDDDFFELGGHSLIAVRLLAKIKQLFAIEYPISILFSAPTVSQLCEALRQSGVEGDGAAGSGGQAQRQGAVTLEPTFRYLVPIQLPSQSTKEPLYIVAGMFGNVLNLRYLGRYLPADQPVYAIQARGLLGDDEPHVRFEDMARDYLEEVRAVQGKGPYYLAGYSGGGVVALEMAQQLHGADETVGLLAMLDTPCVKRPLMTRWDKVRLHWERFRRAGLGYAREWSQARRAWRDRDNRDVAAAATPAEFRSELIQAAFMQAHTAYDLRPYAGHIDLFRPVLQRTYHLGGEKYINTDREFQDPFNHWRPYAAEGMTVHEMPGDHDSMVLEPHVRILGNALGRVLLKAQQADSTAASASRPNEHQDRRTAVVATAQGGT